MMKQDQTNYIWEKTGDIGLLSLNNPPENFIREPGFISLEQIGRILSDSTLKGIIIFGSGRHFSAGADLDNLREMAQDEALLNTEMSKGRELLKIFRTLNIPVIAAIRGVCFG